MNKKDILHTISAVAIGLIMAGLILIINRSQPKTVLTINPPPTPKPIHVYISGEVNQPDLYALPKGSRLNDLIQAAGGLKNAAHDPALNLAAILYDGQHVIIVAPDAKSLDAPIPVFPVSEQLKLNINEADREALCDLPGIGNTKAEAIIQYRQTNGPFEEIEDILNVPGIGEYTFEQIKDLICLNQIYN
jgi:competence protein ComEA